MITPIDPQTLLEPDGPEPLGFLEITEFVNQSLSQINEKKLSPVELAVLEAGWFGITYQKMSDQTEFTKVYLHNDVAPTLWKKLSRAIGQDVGKKTFRSVIDALIKNGGQAAKHPNETCDIGKLPGIDGFIGRESILQNLIKLIFENRCILIVGPSGIGKSSLVAKLFSNQDVLGDFQYKVFKYCIGSPADDVQDLQQLLGLQQQDEIIPFLRSHRCLICFDEIDSWLSKDFEEAERLIRQYTDIEHKSVFLFTSREPIESVERLTLRGRSVKTLTIEGLSVIESQTLAKKYDLNEIEARELHRKYDGNPMYLRQAFVNILSLFGDKPNRPIDLKTSIAGNLYRENLNSILSSQNLRIGEIERGVLTYLVNLPQDSPTNIGQVTNQMVDSGQYTQATVFAAIKTLAGRSLVKLDNSTNPPQITVPYTVQKYILLNPNNVFLLPQEKDLAS